METKEYIPQTKSAAKWYVIYTKPRTEKKVIERLQDIGIEAYCPLKADIDKKGNGKGTVSKPLFNSYCFVKLEEKNLREVFKVDAVVRYIYWCGKPATIRDTELEEVRRWLNDYQNDAIKVKTLKVNDLVKIQSGVLKDKKGKIISKRGNTLTLILPELGLRIAVKINETELEKVSGENVES
jgi:transcriptional antiterminator RfaH